MRSRIADQHADAEGDRTIPGSVEPSRRRHGLRIETQHHDEATAPDMRSFDFSWWKASRYAVVDAHRMEDLPHGMPVHELCPNAFAGNAHLMPRLVDLQALSDEQRAWILVKLDHSVARREQPVVSMLLASEAPAHEVVSHLKHQQAIRQGPSQAWLRLHDPYVFIQLARVLSDRALRELFGPVQRWTIWLADDWHQCTPQPRTGHEAEQGSLPLARPWNAMLRIAAVNRCLLAKGWTSLDQIIKNSQHIDELVQRAQHTYRLSRPADAAAFATMAADLRLEFDQHPLLQPVIDGWRAEGHDADGGSLIEELQALPQEAWNQVRADFPLVS